LLNSVVGLLSGGAATSSTAYESIATTIVGAGGTSTVSFSSISSAYTHLQIRYIALGSSGGGTMTFNSDTATNYSRHYLEGTGAAATSGASTSAANMAIINGSGTANTPAVGIIDVLDYANVNKYKTVRELTGIDINGAGGFIDLFSGNWRSTSAVSTITITAATTFSQYSSFALYGIKGA
jgi:hypothetical protein